MTPDGVQDWRPAKKYRWWNRHRCPHVVKLGIYGDSINFVGGWRLFCPDCGRFLDGPVSLSTAPRPIMVPRV